jgi:spore photoproduct lyase
MELRTKSGQMGRLLQFPANDRVICAFSLSPENVIKRFEARTASLSKRLDAIAQCAEHGWPIGLRFDPILYFNGFESHYHDLVEAVFARIDPAQVHSISIGPMRFPKAYFSKIKKLYPEEPLFAQAFEKRGSTLSYGKEREQQLEQAVLNPLREAGITENKLFRCYV